MSLFPAYAQNVSEINMDCEEVSTASLALEAQLLASDNDEECEKLVEPGLTSSTPVVDNDDYYFDRKFDCGNLRVSTLYYPGRPQYERQKTCPVGREPVGHMRRYWEAQTEQLQVSDADMSTELTTRTKAYKEMLTNQPTDELLWLRFIDFQERCRDAEAALATAEEAYKTTGSCARRLRATLHRLRAEVLSSSRRRELLRAELASNKSSSELTLELWLRLLEEVARFDSGAEIDSAVSAALSATRQQPFAYPHILYLYGGYLRGAGLWEQLVLLVELVLAMNFESTEFPPRMLSDPARLDQIEQHLNDIEDKAIGSGLPLSTVWVRVERARGAAHWRAGGAGGGAGAGADPQRAPLPADVAELLLPAHGERAHLLLLVNVLRLAKVPLLPASSYALHSLLPGNTAPGDMWSVSCGEALMALVRAARRLPPAHPARPALPAHARRVLAPFLDPPHYFTDDTGYLSWVSALWEACCSWCGGEARVALLCWRLRWMHALMMLLDTQEEAGAAEARRMRGEARAALKRWGGNSPLPFAHFARLERAAGGAGGAGAAGGGAAARRAATHALRAALRDRSVPDTHRLYVARVVAEICGETPHDSTAIWASVCAALAQPLPDIDRLSQPPSEQLVNDALNKCEQECTQIELRLEQSDGPSEPDGTQFVRAQLPHAGEWASTRARLAPPHRRTELLAQVCRAADASLEQDALQYWEQGACALAGAAAREHRLVVCARTLAHLFPHNAFLALACSGSPLWSWQTGVAGAGSRGTSATVARTHVGALALSLPALLRGEGGARLARGAAGGALLHALRLETGPRPQATLLAALDDLPNHKWLYVRGAVWCGAQAEALADALLERGLRVHALRDELTPLSITPNSLIQ